MRSSTICLLLSCLAASLMAEPQQYHFAYPSYYPTYIPSQQPSYFRSGFPYPSMTDAAEPAQEVRFFGTVTLTLSTITTTATVRSTTTCTTSTADLVTCTAGRRRRGLIFNGINKEGRSLFYDDQEESEIFLPESKNIDDVPVVASSEEKTRNARETPLVPILIQPGFSAPDNLRNGRLMLSVATSTVTVSTTSTSTAILIAICNSTTSYSTCAASGK